MHKLATCQQPNVFFVLKIKYLYELFETFLLYSGHIHTSPNSSEIFPASVPHPPRPIETNWWRPNILIYLPLPLSLKIATLFC